MKTNHRAHATDHRGLGALYFAVIGFFLLAGCSGFAIDEDERIPLVEGTLQTGSQSDFDYLIDYRYVFKPAGPQQPGQIDLFFTLQRKSRVYSLTVWVSYLDAEGKVLDKNPIYSLGNRSGVVQTTDGTFETPPGTVAIAFTSVSRDFKSKQ